MQARPLLGRARVGEALGTYRLVLFGAGTVAVAVLIGPLMAARSVAWYGK